MKNFRQGQRVRHLIMGPGVVASINNGEMIVIYDERDSHGQCPRGIYDNLWFDLHYDMLRPIGPR